MSDKNTRQVRQEKDFSKCATFRKDFGAHQPSDFNLLVTHWSDRTLTKVQYQSVITPVDSYCHEQFHELAPLLLMLSRLRLEILLMLFPVCDETLMITALLHLLFLQESDHRHIQ